MQDQPAVPVTLITKFHASQGLIPQPDGRRSLIKRAVVNFPATTTMRDIRRHVMNQFWSRFDVITEISLDCPVYNRFISRWYITSDRLDNTLDQVMRWTGVGNNALVFTFEIDSFSYDSYLKIRDLLIVVIYLILVYVLFHIVLFIMHLVM